MYYNYNLVFNYYIVIISEYYNILIMLIEKLYNNGLLQEIWPFLTTKDICNLFVVNKNVKLLSLNINKIISQKIVINFPFASHDFIIHNHSLILSSIFDKFPKIYNLIFDINHINDHKCTSVLYNNKSVCLSLKELTVLMTSDNSGGLSNLNNLTDLNISNSSIIGFGIDIRTMFKIGTLIKITSLNISGNSKVFNDDLSHLQNLAKLKYLYMEDCTGISNDGLVNLSTFTELEHLNLNSCTDISYDGLIHLRYLINLKVLKLKDSVITTLSVLEGLVNITTLDLSCCELLTNQGFSSISCFSDLTFLSLSDCVLLTDDGLIHLSKLIKLKFINFTSCTITNLSSLASLVNLTSLDFWFCTELTDHGFSSISCLTNLTFLDIPNCVLTDDGLSHLSNLTNLTYLNLFDCKCTNLLFLNSLVNLSSLDLGMSNNISNDEWKSISNLTKLQQFSIFDCKNISDADYQYLKTLPQLSELDIDDLIGNKKNVL